MKRLHETPVGSPYSFDVCYSNGTIISNDEFMCADDMLSRFVRWNVRHERGHLRAAGQLYDRRFRAHDERDLAYGTLIIVFYIKGVPVSGATAMSMIIENRERRRAWQHGKPTFRNGPIKGTGKRTAYRFFRRSFKTIGERREAVRPADDLEFPEPKCRARRNMTNLPTPYDDIPRNLDRSWKSSRKHQWRA